MINEALPTSQTVPEVKASGFSDTLHQLAVVGGPTPEQFSEIQTVAGEPKTTTSGAIAGSDHKFVNKTDANVLLESARPEFRLLSHDEVVELEKISKAGHYSELPAGIERDISIPSFEQLRRLRDESNSRLTLNQHLRDEQRAKAQAGQFKARSEREAILTEKLDSEVGEVRKSTYEAELSKALEETEQKLAETDSNPINRHYAKAQLVETAKKRASEAAEKAVSERSEVIEASGGPATIDVIKKSEAKKAEREEFLKRLHGAPLPESAEQKAKKPAFAKMRYNETRDGKYKEWLERSPQERAEHRKANIKAKNAAKKATSTKASSTTSPRATKKTNPTKPLAPSVPVSPSNSKRRHRSVGSPVGSTTTPVNAPEAHEKNSAPIIKVGRAEKVLKGEDIIIEDSANQLYGVIDGMGGMGSGEIASSIIKSEVEAHFSWVKSEGLEIDEINAVGVLRNAFESAKEALSERVDQGGVQATMGATASVIKMFEGTDGKQYAVYGHVGDTRIYRMSGDGTNIEQITSDEGYGSVVNNALQAKSGELNQFGLLEVKPGDRFMICSDGITGDSKNQELTEDEMLEAFSLADPQAAARKFLALSKKHDDKSVLVIDISEFDQKHEVNVEPPAILPPKGKLFARARAFFGNKQAKTQKPEDRNRRKLIGATIAMGALGIAGVIGVLNMGDSTNEATFRENVPTQAAEPTTPNTAISDLNNAVESYSEDMSSENFYQNTSVNATENFSESLSEANSDYTFTAEPGHSSDSLWKASETTLNGYLGRQATVGEINNLKNLLGGDAVRLNVGEKVSINYEQIQRALLADTEDGEEELPATL